MICKEDAEIWPFNFFFKMAAGHHLGFDPTGMGAVRSAVPENPTQEPNTELIGRRAVEIWPFKFFKMAVGRHLEFDPTRNGAI